MKGRPAAQCCICGAVKGARDSNQEWWVWAPRRKRGGPREARDYCPACAPRLHVRADEAKEAPDVAAGLRIFRAREIYMMLATMRSAAMGFEPRSTMGWEAALRVAPLVGFTGLQPALQLREFGFIPGETP